MGDKYYQEAKRVYQQRVEREIEQIARELEKADKEKELRAIRDKCPHPSNRISYYNHGRYAVCNDCGEEL